MRCLLLSEREGGAQREARDTVMGLKRGDSICSVLRRGSWRRWPLRQALTLDRIPMDGIEKGTDSRQRPRAGQQQRQSWRELEEPQGAQLSSYVACSLPLFLWPFPPSAQASGEEKSQTRLTAWYRRLGAGRKIQPEPSREAS